MSWCNSEKKKKKEVEKWKKLMVRSGGIDEPAAVYMAARDIRLEYHLSFIQVDKTSKTISKNIETDLQ